MKVCTDACLFGAWVAGKSESKTSIRNILDIGAGTGLLSLMLAQKNYAVIDAVELNADAALQAKQNFDLSPWASRLTVFHTNIIEYNPGKKYDLIISNPPFFEDDLKSDDLDRNAAMHSITLNLQVLLQQVKRLLAGDGLGCVLVPYHRTSYLEKIIEEQGFYVSDKMLVKQSVDHGYFRTMILFSGNPAKPTTEELCIHNGQRQYSDAFTHFLKDYYLKL